MALRRLLYILGISLTVVGLLVPWSCRRGGDQSWRCTSGLTVRYAERDGLEINDVLVLRYIEHDNSRRLDVNATVASAVTVVLLSVIVACFAAAGPRFMRRRRLIALGSSAALVLAAGYHMLAVLTAPLWHPGAFTAFSGGSSAIVCVGALLTLFAATIDRRSAGQPLA